MWLVDEERWRNNNSVKVGSSMQSVGYYRRDIEVNRKSKVWSVIANKVSPQPMLAGAL